MTDKLARLASQALSTASLGQGVAALEHQQVKQEPPEERAHMQAQLEELRKVRAAVAAQDINAVPTAVSATTPQKPLKKQRVEAEESSEQTSSTTAVTPETETNTVVAKKLDFDAPLDGEVDCNGSDGGLGGTGSNDEISTLKGKVASLTFENMGLQRELEKLQGQLQALSLNEPGAAGGGGEDEAEEEPSDEAVRKRLHRLFKRRSDGSLQVPIDIHEEYTKGGASRQKLVDLFASCNFDKARFLVQVTLEKQQREQMTIKIKAQWATEEKMRDVLKLPESRIKAVKDYCTKRADHTKHDRYEQKTQYWYEEELVAEYEHQVSKSRREEMQYETERDAAEAMHDMSQPIGADMSRMKSLTHGGGASGAEPSGAMPNQPSVLPQVHKNEPPSSVILKFLDGISKRAGKVADLKAKYDAIPAELKTSTHTALLEKMDTYIQALESCHSAVNDVYSTGAVEGYGPEQEAQLKDLYKKATKVAQESLTLETRCKSIPVPKTKEAAPKGKAKAKAKAKAKVKAKAKP